jgi:type IV secretion system protein VirB5
MKRVVLAGVCALALMSPARADLPVIDNASLAQLFQQVKQGLQELQLLQQQLEQVMAVYNSLSHVTDLANAVGVLQTLGIQNPLPVNIGAVQGLLAGTGSTQGMLGSIGGLFNTNFDANHVYTPTGDGFEATLLQRNATSIAGIQALAGQAYQSMSDRLNAMRQLQDRLATAQDTKDVEDLQARLQSEQAYIQSQSAQVQTLAIMQVAAYQSLQQQREEQRQQDIDAVLAADPNR